MQFITTKSPTTLTALTQQVFTMTGPKAAAANPQWGDRTKLPAGALVIVPDVPGARATASPAEPMVSPAVVAQLQQALKQARAVLERAATSRTEEVDASLGLAKSRELVALAKESSDVRTRLAQTTEQAKLRLKQIAADQKTQLEGLAQLKKDLGSLSV